MINRSKERIAEKGLKVTPQRIAVFESLLQSSEHPTAEMVMQDLEKRFSSISTGTVYRVLETFVEVGLVRRVKTEKDIKRYDAHIQDHHHLYCEESNRVRDYEDEELNKLLTNYFKNKNIPGFDVRSIRVQIDGKFK